MDEHEEFEQIPWSQLTSQEPGGRRRTLYLVAAGLGVLILGVLVARALTSPGTEPPASSVATLAEGSASSTTAAAGGAVEEASPGPAIVYREEDLMAFPEAVAELAAVARAEWFVTDYFTADLEPAGSADVRTALPSGAELPDMPQDAASSLSYVEWARAFRVEEAGEGRFRVGVVFRCLGAPPDGGFYRLAVRAVEVTVEVTDDGGSVVVDLPTPVALPAGPEPEAWPEDSEDAPQSVVDAALSRVSGWGSEPRLVAAQQSQAGWRVVLTLADEVGNRWPVAVLVGDGGEAAGG